MNLNVDEQLPPDLWEAYEKFYNDHYPAFYKQANRIIKDTAAAKDVVSKVFADLLIKLPGRGIDILQVPYGLVCVRNECLNHIRRKNKEQTSQSDLAQITKMEENGRAEKEISEELQRMLKKLDPTLRQTMELLYLEELDFATVAAKMDVSLPTVYARRKKALRILREIARKLLLAWHFITLLGIGFYKR